MFCDRFILRTLPRVEEPSTRRFEEPKLYIDFVLCTYLTSIHNILVNTVSTLAQGPDIFYILIINNLTSWLYNICLKKSCKFHNFELL